jgi:alpha-1,6-mannosyltransferase
MAVSQRARLYCDLTQSWSEHGGGVGTYLRRKRAHLLDNTPHRHLLIVPGERDEIVAEGRAAIARIASPLVPRNPNYRLLLRNGAVKRLLERFRPDLIECQDSYNLPWAAIAHRRRHPETVLVAGYCTDFPTAYVRRFGEPWAGAAIAAAAQRLCYHYCGRLYRRFDGLYALSEAGGAKCLRQETRRRVFILPFGIDLDRFAPKRRDPKLRARLGAGPGQPILIYAGRLDAEKRCETVFEAFLKLPEALGAILVMAGEGNLRDGLIARSRGRGVHFPGFVGDRSRLAALLASADLYVSGMADETFGLSVIEAQASGLPVIGVASGAMVERVPDGLGLLGPVGDADAMAANIQRCWAGDPAAMGRRARAWVADHFTWSRTFDMLFGEIYPRAQARRATALRLGATQDVPRSPAAAAGKP